MQNSTINNNESPKVILKNMYCPALKNVKCKRKNKYKKIRSKDVSDMLDYFSNKKKKL